MLDTQRDGSPAVGVHPEELGPDEGPILVEDPLRVDELRRAAVGACRVPARAQRRAEQRGAQSRPSGCSYQRPKYG